MFRDVHASLYVCVYKLKAKHTDKQAGTDSVFASVYLNPIHSFIRQRHPIANKVLHLSILQALLLVVRLFIARIFILLIRSIHSHEHALAHILHTVSNCRI